jgi:endonuclease/exonuclease/phosphatase family metal-dependent hydrolase
MTAAWAAIKRSVSRIEWARRLLGLPVDEHVADEAGLVMIQIDGLSREQFEAALNADRMPALASLLKHDHYRLHSFYSGLPASTPAVQGELFYGKRCAVPAFGFRQHETERSVVMFSQPVAERVQQRIEVNGEGLLVDGSAYCNIYTGGARESHFCAASLGWSDVLKSIHPIRVLVVLALYGLSVVRAIALAILELGLAVISFLRRATTGKELWRECVMIPARVVVAILMREWLVIGTSIDVARGLPVIHANLLGYDEHAHRRGPTSDFAHWTLKGIDGAIRRIVRAAHQSNRRHYDVWVYSDHGQESTTPYEYVSGRTIQKVCESVVESVCGEVPARHCTPPKQANEEQANKEQGSEPPRPSRAQWLSAGWVAKILFGDTSSDETDSNENLQVSACGPVGLLYVRRSIEDATRIEIAQRLVDEHQVPMACVALSPDDVIAITRHGRFSLPEDGSQVFGHHHPFLEQVVEDWMELCNHADAGDVVISGWDREQPPLTFTSEHGSHAGPGTCETHAFALLPGDAPLPNESGFMRPSDLRSAARTFLGRAPDRKRSAAAKRVSDRIRVMTYNVHGCLGMDGMLSPSRIARVIAQSDVDVVALQELDVGRNRSRFADQAAEIARHLRMDHHFHAAWSIEEEQYGNAILSRYPLRLIESGVLPSTRHQREPRAVIWGEISVGERPLQLLCTHLSLYPGERLQQARALAEHWVPRAKSAGDTILCGDLNAAPGSPAYRVLAEILHDAHDHAEGPTRATFFSPQPLARIDHAFCSDGLTPVHASVLRSRLARMASDHVPLIVEFTFAAAVRRDQTAKAFDADRLEPTDPLAKVRPGRAQ